VFVTCHGHGTMHDHYVKGEHEREASGMAPPSLRGHAGHIEYIAATTYLIVHSFIYYLLQGLGFFHVEV
jgi:hypothetical protein